jgi:NADH dehydrogenase/NADH:ubiquinone oxidoreductase subunit G
MNTQNTITVTIDVTVCTAEKGEYILDIAERTGIFIPHLCHHPALPGLGACRLCVVEVNEGGRPSVVVSCVYPVTKDCEVATDNAKIKRLRANVIALLRDRAPAAVEMQGLAYVHGVPANDRFTAVADEKCILCGLCAKACAEMGTGAISTVGRGIAKKIATPYEEASPDCIGCTACAQVCPTHAIEFSDDGKTRAIWGKTFELVTCADCGKPFATREELDHLESDETRCADCRKKAAADVFAGAFGVGKAG